jgi:LAS superfamily LD-carboxypeptidase LdcB
MIDRQLNDLELTGRARTHVAQMHEPRFAAQPMVAAAFLEMRADAREAGFDLVPVSTFRDFRTQLRIWNQKFTGHKPLYDIDGRIREFAKLSASEIIDCILNWSALPGGSRHHWGTEIDVIDAAATPPGYAAKLLPEEVSEGGLFFPLHVWLDENISKYGFFRPYKRYIGGMYPEPWHLSYAPLSTPAVAQISVDLLAAAIEESDILAKDLVLERIPVIYQEHILNFVAPQDQ